MDVGFFLYVCLAENIVKSIEVIEFYETAFFVVSVMNFDGSSLYFGAGVSSLGNKSAAVGPSSPNGSTTNGLS